MTDWIFLFLLSLHLSSFSKAQSPTVAPVTSKVNQCVLRCKDNHMREMDNEWTSDFTFPILNLLKTSGSEDAAYNKARNICEGNALLESCLSACNASQEVRILIEGLRSWTDTCMNLDEIRGEFPCWRKHGSKLSTACSEATDKLRKSMEQFAVNMTLPVLETVCIKYDEFTQCFVAEYKESCGLHSEKLTEQMFSTNKKAMFKMLTLKFDTLPSVCEDSLLLSRRHLPDMMQFEELSSLSNKAHQRLIMTVWSISMISWSFFKLCL